MLKLLTIAFVTLTTGPALASASAWQEVSLGVRARLISSDALNDGRAMAALELDLPAGTNTYWRIPGETGIPTEIDLSASRGVRSPEVYWPFPTLDTSTGYHDYVYRGTVVFPISYSGDPAGGVISASITLGVCSDICVPARVTLSLPVTFGQPDPAQSIRIDLALAQTPIPWDQPRPPFAEVTAGPDGSIHIAAPDSSINAASLIADVGDPNVLFAAPQKSPDGALWTLRPLGLAAPRGLAGLPVQLTFMTPNGPYQVTRTLNTSAPQ